MLLIAWCRRTQFKGGSSCQSTGQRSWWRCFSRKGPSRGLMSVYAEDAWGLRDQSCAAQILLSYIPIHMWAIQPTQKFSQVLPSNQWALSSSSTCRVQAARPSVMMLNLLCTCAVKMKLQDAASAVVFSDIFLSMPCTVYDYASVWVDKCASLWVHGIYRCAALILNQEAKDLHAKEGYSCCLVNCRFLSVGSTTRHAWCIPYRYVLLQAINESIACYISTTFSTPLLVISQPLVLILTRL